MRSEEKGDEKGGFWVERLNKKLNVINMYPIRSSYGVLREYVGDYCMITY